MVMAKGLVVQPKKNPIIDWCASKVGVNRRRPSLLWPGDPVVRLYDAETASEVMAFPHCSQASFSPDGQLIATVTEDGTIRIWPAQPTKSLALLAALLAIWLAEVIGTYVLTRRLAAC